MSSGVKRAVITGVVGFAIPIVYWAVPGGRGAGSMAEAVLIATVCAAVGAVYGLARAKMRSGAREAGQEMRGKRGRRGA